MCQLPSDSAPHQQHHRLKIADGQVASPPLAQYLPCQSLPGLNSLQLKQEPATSFTARHTESARRHAHPGRPAIAGRGRLGRRGPVGVHAAHGRGGGPEVRAALGHARPGGLRVAVVLRTHRRDQIKR